MFIKPVAVLWTLEVCEIFPGFCKKYIVNYLFCSSVVLVHIYKRHNGDVSRFLSFMFCSLLEFFHKAVWLCLLVSLLERK
jgi:hypothetical protein